MASSLLALLDDITTLLDDVAILTKVAAKQTAGVLGDDLALNAQQVSGVQAERELPVVWAVAKGSVVNKLILVPAALALSSFAPWAVTPILMAGGAYLCLEGMEKLAHAWLTRSADEAAHEAALMQALADPQMDLRVLEKEKIAGAIRTDFVLSAEIIVIALGTVAQADVLTRTAVLLAVAALMTVGVYGAVAGIVKLDDLGLYLRGRRALWLRRAGAGLLLGAPYLMKTLSIAGTAAMFLVGGGILVHGIAPLHHAVGRAMQGAGPVTGLIGPLLADAGTGIAAGALVMAFVQLAARLRR